MSDDYTYTPEHLSGPDIELFRRILAAMHAGRHEEGLALVRQRLDAELSQDPKALAELRFLMAGFLIDLGEDAVRPELIEEGAEVFEACSETIADLVGTHAVDYCLGNAKYGLYKHAVRQGQVKFKPENLGLLLEAKDYFWRAVRAIEQSGEKAAPQIYINLGNTLDSSGRVIEAIRCYDRALRIDPSFGMANINRGIALETLNKMSDTFTVNQVQQQKRHFVAAIADARVPERERATARTHLEQVEKVLGHLDAGETVEEHEEHVKKEIKAASPFRRFCIEQNLALNEHALYCRCIGAQSDSLRIPKSTQPIGGEFVPAMELLLNRIRAEFGLARMLYYRYIHGDGDTAEYEPEYSELFDNEELGLHTELLRTSFRLCFGILDRIAFAVCMLFDLAEKDEHIYFESFWKKPRPKTAKQKERWQKINDTQNWGLVALYSQATDLSTRRGEWRHYKDWRNRLEHEALVLTSGELDLGPWVAREAGDRLEAVDIDVFEKETLHLLQMTAAAIFYFTYCVRAEGIKARPDKGVTMTIDKRDR